MAINLTSKLNYKIEDQEERIKISEQVLSDSKKDLDKYFDDYFDVHPNSGKHGGALSSENGVCKQLDMMANYILYSPGAERVNPKNTEYNFYTEEKFNEQERKKANIDAIVNKINNHKNSYEDTSSTTTQAEVIDYLIRTGDNYKKEIQQEISKVDIKDPELKIVKEYQEYINASKKELDLLRKENKNKKKQYKLVRTMRKCKGDQIYCKDSIKGTIYFKNVLPDTTDIDYDQFDFFDAEHVLCLLKFEPRKLTTDLGILIYDLSQLLKHIKMSKQDKKILKMWRQDALTQFDIAKGLNITQQHVASTLNKIAIRVVNVFEVKYEDWYYLNLVKGRYKKCSCCGGIKLANERYFSINKNSKDNLHSICKLCRKIT